MANSEEKRLMSGFLFQSERDAKLAEVERKKIAYLESKLDYSKPEDILYIYDKTVKGKVFSTPVGMMYLKKLQEFLLGQDGIDPALVAAIPLNNIYHEHSIAVKERIQEKKDKTIETKKSQLTISIVLNIFLAIAMIAMFIISLNSDNPNIINYERNITNRYATWEQELTERENVIREKERELMIEGDFSQN